MFLIIFQGEIRMSSHIQLSDNRGELIKVMLEKGDKRIQLGSLESDQKMIQQTIALLAEGGMQAVTLQAVGNRAGYSRGWVSRRYGSKEQLFIHVLNALHDWFEKIVCEATWRQHGVNAIESLIKALSDHCYEHSAQFKAYFWLSCLAHGGHRHLKQRLLGMRQSMAKYYTGWLKEALVLEEIARNSDIDMMADFIMSSVMGLIQTWMINPSFNLELRLKQLAEIHLRNMFKHSHLYYSANYWGE